MATHMETVLRAAAFAAEKHRNQRRKDEEASPYINHPIQLAYILLVKLADKIANVSDINGAPPAGWSLERKREYFDWAKQVVDRLRGVHAGLEARFDAEYFKRP